MSIACGITKSWDEFHVETHNIKTRKSSYFRPKDKSIYDIIDELIAKYGDNIGIIAIDNKEGCFKKDNFKRYGNLVHLAAKKDLGFSFYLIDKVEYPVEELIISFQNEGIILYQCTKASEGTVTWKELDKRKHEFNERIDFDYIEKMFHLNMNQVHVVFDDRREEVNRRYSSELDKYNFKSINFHNFIVLFQSNRVSLLSRHLISDPEVSVLVKTELSYKNNSETFTIENSGFICVPKLVKEYESRTDIMGIDLGSTTSVLAVSRNTGIHVIPFDNSSPGDLWTESVVSFDEDKPLFGKAAIRRLKTKPDHVIFDHKLFYSLDHRDMLSEQSILPFKFNFKNDQIYIGSMTSKGWKEFSIEDINAIFLGHMAKSASDYQDDFNRNPVTKAVITIPTYFHRYGQIAPFISSAIEAAKLANIKVIDIIEETHADLLYYFSNARYYKMIKPGMSIAIFDIGGGTTVCNCYEIFERDGKRHAICFRELHTLDDYGSSWSGRAIDNILIKELEKSIPEDLRKHVKLRTLETAKKIKNELSFKEKDELDLSEIHQRLEGIVEFTREWLENKLKSDIDYFDIGSQKFREYPFLITKQSNLETIRKYILNPPFNDIDIVFLAGGTCRIPFVQNWIIDQFPKAEIVIDGQLEVITATGAAIHALQVLSGEVEPYIKRIQQRSSEFDLSNKKADKKQDKQNSSLEDGLRMVKKTADNQYPSGTTSYIDPQMLAAQLLNQLISFKNDPLVDDVIKNNILSIFMECFSDTNRMTELKAVQNVMNTVSGTSEHPKAIVRAKAVESFFILLRSSNFNISEQALNILTKMIENDPYFHDTCIQLSMVYEFLNLVKRNIPLNFLINITSIMLTLCESKDVRLKIKVGLDIAPVLDVLIRHKDTNILLNTVLAYSELTEGGKGPTVMIIIREIAERLVDLLDHSEVMIQTAALRSISNIVRSTDKEAQFVLDSGALNMMKQLLIHSEEEVNQGALLFLSTVTAGNKDRIQTVINTNLIPLIVNFLDHENPEIQKQASQTICNVISNGIIDQVIYVVNCNVIPLFCHLLGICDTQVIQVILYGLEGMLRKAGMRTTEIYEEIKICGGLSKIKYLQKDKNKDISKLACEVVNTFFLSDDNEELATEDNSLFNDTQNQSDKDDDFRNNFDADDKATADQDHSHVVHQPEVIKPEEIKTDMHEDKPQSHQELGSHIQICRNREGDSSGNSMFDSQAIMKGNQLPTYSEMQIYDCKRNHNRSENASKPSQEKNSPKDKHSLP